jgi:hypothetical protein
MSDDRSTRRGPPEDADDWVHLWRGADYAHRGWPFVSVVVAVFGNWRVIGAGILGGIAVGGADLLAAMGILP